MVGDATSLGAGLGIGLFFFVFIALDIAIFVLWIMSIVDFVRRPEWQWRLAGKERVLWIVLVIVLNFLAIYYWFWLRKDLQRVEQAAAAGLYGPGQMTVTGWQPSPWAWTPGAPPGTGAVAPAPGSGVVAPPPGSGAVAPPPGSAAMPPPGWYPDPAGAPGRRYWDGGAWTTHVHP
jgi:hypothetical protein